MVGTVVDLVDLRFSCSCLRWPFAVGIEGKRCLEMSSVVRPGHVRKLPLRMAVMKDDLVGQPAAVWIYVANSAFVLSYRSTALREAVERDGGDVCGADDCDDEMFTSQRPLL